MACVRNKRRMSTPANTTATNAYRECSSNRELIALRDINKERSDRYQDWSRRPDHVEAHIIDPRCEIIISQSIISVYLIV